MQFQWSLFAYISLAKLMTMSWHNAPKSVGNIASSLECQYDVYVFEEPEIADGYINLMFVFEEPWITDSPMIYRFSASSALDETNPKYDHPTKTKK